MPTGRAPESRPRRLLKRLARLLAIYPAGWVLFSLYGAISRPTTGVAALGMIVAPHLFLVGFALVPLAVVTRERVLVVAMAAALAVGLVRFGNEWLPLPAAGHDGSPVRLVSWNLQAGETQPGEVIQALLAREADVVALQELRPDVAAALAADERVTDRYPYRFLNPDPEVFGTGLLSAYPILESEAFTDPAGEVVRLDLGDGRGLTVLNAHPMPGDVGAFTFDARERDTALERLRPRIDTLLNSDDHFVVIGDYNVTPDEPGYGMVSAGLRDAHREAGLGTGWTWRPGRFERLRSGLVRIDYVFTGPTVAPLSTAEDCSYSGDHCILSAVVAVP